MEPLKIFGTGEMAGRIRAKDWSNTSLGSLAQWPESLLVALNTILSIPTPMQLFWGPERLTLYNDAFIPFLTNKHPTSLGQPVQAVWAEAWKDIGQQFESVFTEGRSYAYENLPLQLLQNGELQDLHFTFTYSPVFGTDGAVVGLLNGAQNTTETYRAQLALKESERRFRLLVDRASVGIAIGSTKGDLTYINPTLLKVLDYTAEDVAKDRIRWDQLTPPEYSDLDLVAIEQLQTVGIAAPYEKAYRNRSGEPVPFLIGASVIPSDSAFGEHSDVAVFATDLRNQKRAESALVQSEKLAAVGKLASSISHEINNPLEAVTNLIYIVRQDPHLAQESRSFLETADRELARVSQVTSQTLRFHRQSTAPRTVGPQVLIEEVLQLYHARLANSNIAVHRDYSADLQLTCYEGEIRQVLNNLVGNAIDAMRRGGHLSIRTRAAKRWSRAEDGVLLTFADTGSGMSTEVRRHIFEAFYTTKGVNGTGLGLWISQSIVLKHGGYLQAYSSTAAGRCGTVFHLWLPAILANSANEAWHKEAPAQAATSPR